MTEKFLAELIFVTKKKLFFKTRSFEFKTELKSHASLPLELFCDVLSFGKFTNQYDSGILSI